MNPHPEATLPESDVRAIVRLLGNIAAEGGGLASKRIQLMTGLCKLIVADRWLWLMMGEINTGKTPAHTIFLHDGFSEDEFVAYLKTQEHPDIKWMTAPFLDTLAQAQGQITRTAQQLDPENRLSEAAIAPLMEAAGVGPVLMSGRPTQAGQLSTIVVARRVGQALFSPREARIAHIILSEVTWLHDESWPEHPREGITHLPPRLRTVLTLLIQGQGRKQIAADLNISIHTVGGYIKDIYRAFRVHSQTELLRRFVEGDGGDQTAET